MVDPRPTDPVVVRGGLALALLSRGTHEGELAVRREHAVPGLVEREELGRIARPHARVDVGGVPLLGHDI